MRYSSGLFEEQLCTYLVRCGTRLQRLARLALAPALARVRLRHPCSRSGDCYFLIFRDFLNTQYSKAFKSVCAAASGASTTPMSYLGE